MYVYILLTAHMSHLSHREPFISHELTQIAG